MKFPSIRNIKIPHVLVLLTGVIFFAPGIVSTNMSEFSCIFSPDGESFYFANVECNNYYNKQ